MADTSNVTIGLLGRFRDKIKEKLDAVHSSATLANKTAQLGVQSLGYVSNNILRNTQPTGTQTINGLTFVKSAAGEVTVSGTATADTQYVINDNLVSIGGIKHRLWGCPDGGTDTTYSLVAECSSGEVISCYDKADGTIFNNASSSLSYNVYISVKSGTTLSSATFSPLICMAAIERTAYAPYKSSIYTQLTSLKDDVSKQTAINKTSIGMQAKNVLQNKAVYRTVNGGNLTVTINDDKSITLNGTAGTADEFLYTNLRTNARTEDVQFDNYQLLDPGASYIVSGGVPGKIIIDIAMSSTPDTVENVEEVYESRTVNVGENYIYTWVRLKVHANATFNNETIYPMIRYSAIEDDTYEPYIPSLQTQADTTYEVASTLVDRVPKNLIKIVPTEHYGVDISIDDNGQMVLNGTNTSSTAQIYRMSLVYLEAGVHYTLVDDAITESGAYYVHLRDSDSLDTQGSDFVNTLGTRCKDFTVETSSYYLVAIRIPGSATFDNMVLRPMLCLRSDYEMSEKFVPYADSNLELQFRTEDLEMSVATNTTNIVTNTTNISTIDATLTDFMKDVFGVPTPAIASNDDLDTYTTVGAFACPSQAVASTLSNCPVKSAFRLEVKTTGAANRLIHIIYPNTSTGEIYMRNYTSSGWSAWHVYKDAGAIDVNSAYDAIAGPSFTGRINLLEILEKSYTKNGITITCNDGGSITLDGTSTSSGAFISVYDLRAGYTTSASHQNYRLLGSGDYILSGCTANCRIQVFGTDTLDAVGSQIVASPADGSAATFTITDSHKYVYTRLYIAAGASFSNETIYPMIRKADVADGTWVEAKGSLQFQIDSLRKLIVDNILNGTW